MTRNMAKKLHSARGVSMIMAMVAFLVVTMVSLVIVTAAISATKTVRDDKETNQNMLYLNSAAKILKNELSENYVWYREGCSIVSGENPIFLNIEKSTGIYQINGFPDAFQTLYSSTDPELRGKGSFLVSVNLPSDMDQAAKDVLVEYVMFPKEYYEAGQTELDSEHPYKVIFTLSVVDAEETMFMEVDTGIIVEKSSQPMDPAVREKYSLPDSYTTLKTKEVRWDKFVRSYNAEESTN